MMDNQAMDIMQSYRDRPVGAKVDSGLSIVSMGVFSRMEGHYMHRARTTDHLLIWVMDGRGFACSGAQRVQTQAGDLLAFDRGPWQEYGADKDEPWSIMWVHYDGRAGRQYFNLIRQSAAFGGRLSGRLGLDGRTRRRFEEMVAYSRWERQDSQLVQVSLLHGVLGLMIHQLNLPGGGAGQQRGRADDVAVVLAYVDEHLTETMDVPVLAGMCSMSVRQFTRVFTQQMGVSPAAYVQKRRVEHAAMLLSQTDMPIKQVGQAVGCDDAYYFSRMFSKAMGQPPRAYREKMRRR